MALPGELKRIDGTQCSDCDADLELQVCQSAAGFYLGYFCDRCGPYSRESGYFRTRKEAEKALRGECDQRLRNTNFNPAGLTVTCIGSRKTFKI